MAGKTFNALISKDRTFDKVPRYYQIVFLAFYKLLVIENKKINSQYELLKLLDGMTASIKLSQGGGNWSASEKLGISADRYFQKLIQILDKEPIDEQYKSYIGNNIRFIDYGGKSILIMKIEGLDKPAIYDNQYYQRKGANLDKIEPKDMGMLFSRFIAQ